MHMKKSYCLGTIAQMAVTAFIMICIAMISTGGKQGGSVLPSIIYFELFYGVFMPIILAVLFCFLRNKGNFHFRMVNIKSSKSVIRLVIRMMVVVVFLTAQGIIEKNHMDNKLANIMGDAIPEVLPYLICNFNLAIMISLYPITYGIVELLFVDAEK